MYTKPYNLASTTENPNQFYIDLENFVPEVILKGEMLINNYTSDYEAFIKSRALKKYKSEEYLMEVLMLGVFWKNYKTYLSIDALFYQPLFNQLYRLRKKYKLLKPNIDKLRGKLLNNILLKRKNKDLQIQEYFEYLTGWLNCSKEFNEEVERLENWKLFIEQKPLNQQKEFWNKTLEFAEWFTYEADKKLGKYTAGWADFMMDTTQVYKNREDAIFCSRKPNEYHMNMVAAQIMNQSLKPAYDKTKNKIVLLPTCMVKSNNCKAKMVNNKLVCQNCNSECNVNRINQSLNKQGYSTVLIPHSTGFSKYLKPWENSKDTALIGVACVLNLLTGGYEMQKLNIPAQCLFLDSCGCKKHWLSGKPTNLNKMQLNKLLINDKAKQPANSISR